jgi:acylphosphatase
VPTATAQSALVTNGGRLAASWAFVGVGVVGERRYCAAVTTADDRARLTAWVRGRVQGVGFRWWVRSQALGLGLVGSAANLDDGRVEVVAEGPRAACERLLELLAGPASNRRPGTVLGVVERWSRPDPTRPAPSGFTER